MRFVQGPALACIGFQAQLYTVSFVRVDRVDVQNIRFWRRVPSRSVIAAHVVAHVVSLVPVEVAVSSWVSRGQRFAMRESGATSRGC